MSRQLEEAVLTSPPAPLRERRGEKEWDLDSKTISGCPRSLWREIFLLNLRNPPIIASKQSGRLPLWIELEASPI